MSLSAFLDEQPPTVDCVGYEIIELMNLLQERYAILADMQSLGPRRWLCIIKWPQNE